MTTHLICDYTPRQVAHLLMASDGFGIRGFCETEVFDVRLQDAAKVHVYPARQCAGTLVDYPESDDAIIAMNRLLRAIGKLNSARMR